MDVTGTISSVWQRGVTFTELFNFRDLGGYPALDGRMVARQRVFRSDDLCQLRGDDQLRFTALGIRTVIDLRRPEEIAKHGRIPEIGGVDYHHLYLEHPWWPHQEYADVAERAAYLVARYQEMASAGGEAIGTALRLIADADTAPLVFHCYAGKDRTGIVAALTLSLLGVDDGTIAADYALSETSDALFRARRGKPPTDYMTSPEAAMLGFLAQLRAQHGSIESYVQSLGVDDDHVKAMRAHLLT